MTDTKQSLLEELAPEWCKGDEILIDRWVANAQVTNALKASMFDVFVSALDRVMKEENKDTEFCCYDWYADILRKAKRIQEVLEDENS